MMRNLTFHSAVLILGLLTSTHPAMATWGPFVKMGTNVMTPDPSCTFLTTGQAVCGARSSKHSLLVSQYNGTTWSVWKDLGGALTSNPSCTDDGAGRAVCAAQGATGAMFAATFNGTVWSKVLLVGGRPHRGRAARN